MTVTARGADETAPGTCVERACATEESESAATAAKITPSNVAGRTLGNF